MTDPHDTDEVPKVKDQEVPELPEDPDELPPIADVPPVKTP